MRNRTRSRSWHITATVLVFVAVQGWLAWLVLGHGSSIGDLTLYKEWIRGGITAGHWPVLTWSWVYPFLALVPMRIAGFVSTTSTTAYAAGWLGLVALLDAVACLMLMRRFGWKAGSRAALLWMAFLALLGPVGVARIDAISAVCIALALTWLANKPRLAALLLAVGTWIKIAPAAVLLALFAAARRRSRDVVVPAFVLCLAVLGAWVLFSSRGGNLLSFISEQNGRGLQIESVFAVPVLIARLAHGQALGAENLAIHTMETSGYGANLLALAATALMPLAMIGLAVLVYKARRQGMRAVLLGSLCLLYAMIVFNKVGSPQFEGWLAPVFAVALAYGADPLCWRKLTIAALATAGLTQALYSFAWRPGLYVGGYTLRNLLVVLTLAYATICLARLGKEQTIEPQPQPISS